MLCSHFCNLSLKSKRKYLISNLVCRESRQNGAKTKTSHICLVTLNEGFASVAFIRRKFDKYITKMFPENMI